MAGSVLVRHIPLSLLYAAVNAIKEGFDIQVVDVRLNPDCWQNDISALLTSDTLLVGISVMTGPPLKNALEISRWMKTAHPTVPIVWGGPHTAFNASEVLAEPSVDYVIAGYGSAPLAHLAKLLRGDSDALSLESIAGILYRGENQVQTIPCATTFEIIDYRDIPYHLVEANLHLYGQLDSTERIFPMYSAMGCPYQCSFCSSPAQYRSMAKKYEFLSPAEVAEHVAYVYTKYGATYIYFIDDDSFVHLDHVEAIIDEIRIRDIKVGLGFRGARINEIVRMSDGYLTKLAEAGTNILHIGAESGSQRMLDLMRKDCTVEDIIEINRKLARHPEIKAAYNWLVGIPGETLEDLRETRLLMLKLAQENPGALIFMPNKYRPLPGTALYEKALERGYTPPLSLEKWGEMEAEGDYRPPWYIESYAKMINMIQVTSFFIDDKIYKVKTGRTIIFTLARLCGKFYKPLAICRMKFGITAFLIEYKLFHWFSSRFR